MTIYLGLGSNEGDRRQHLERAIAALVKAGFRLRRVSPVVESPALLPAQADPDWNQPYLNLALSGDAPWQPHQGLAIAKQIELELGRKQGARWSPRPIDIDLLRWHDEVVPGDAPTAGLTIPHADAHQRDFVLTPLLHLQPDLRLGGHEGHKGYSETVFALTQTIRPIPLWMAIINLTPDSFSDGAQWSSDAGELDAYLDRLIAQNVQIIDVGAESTRPGSMPLAPEEEWRRLQPTLEKIAERLKGRRVKPWLSLDSRHPAIVEKALNYGVDVINDVTGLTDVDMMSLARSSDCQVVAMHSVSVPVEPNRLLPGERSAVSQIRQWAEEKMEIWTKAGLDLNRILLDPGIGFGKSSLQALELLSHCRALRQAGLRLLIGHSRKSFMGNLTDRPAGQRDLETLGISLSLCQQGVDVIRVHSPFIHLRAYRGWSHAVSGGQELNDPDK